MLKSHKRNSNNVQNSQQSQNFIGNSQLQSQNKLLLSNNQNLGNKEDNKKQEKKKLTYQEEQILREKREDFILDLQEHYDSVNETLEKLIYIKKELNSYKINDQEKIQFKKMIKKDVQTTQDLIRQMDQVNDKNILGKFTTKFILFGYKQALQDLLELMNIIQRIELDQNELQSLKIDFQKHQKGVNLNREIKNSSIRVQKLKVGNRLKTVLDEQQQNQLKLNEEEKEKFEKQKQLKKKQMYNNNKKMNELLDQLNQEEMENQEKIKRDQQIREKEEEDNILEKFLQKKQNIKDNEENFQQMVDQEKIYGDSLFEEEEVYREIQNEKQQKEAEFFQEKEKNLRQMINSFMKVSKNDPNFSYKYHNLDLYFKERFSLQTLYLGQQQLEDFIECAPKKNLKQQLDKQKIKQQKDQINLDEIQADHQLTALHRINLINQEITDELNAQFHEEKMSQINKIFMDHHKEQWSKSGQQKDRSKNQQNQQKKVEEKKPFLHVRPLMTKAIKEKIKNQEYREEDRLLAEGTIIPIQQLYLNSHPNNPFIENLFGNVNKLNGDKIQSSTFGPGNSSGNKKMIQSQKLNKDIKVQNQNESKIFNQIEISKGSEQDGENLFTEEQQKYKNTYQSDSFKKQISYNQDQIKKKTKNSFDKNQLEEYFTYLKSNNKKENSQLSTLNSTLLKSPRNEGILNNINNENQSKKFKTQGNFFSQKLNQNQEVNINEKIQTNEKNNEILGKMNRTQSSSYLQLDNQKIANNSSLNFLQKYEFLKNQSSSINNKNKLQYNYENFYKQNQSKQKVIDLNDFRANTGEKQKSRQMYYLNEKGGNQKSQKSQNNKNNNNITNINNNIKNDNKNNLQQKFKSEQSRIEYLQKYENDNVTLYLSRYGTSKIRMTSPSVNQYQNYNTNFNYSSSKKAGYSQIQKWNQQQQLQQQQVQKNEKLDLNLNLNLNLNIEKNPILAISRPGTTFQGDGGGNQNEYNSYDINQNQQGNLFSKTSMGRFRNTSENQNLSQKYNQNNNQDLNQKLRYNLVNLTKLNGDQWIMQ